MVNLHLFLRKIINWFKNKKESNKNEIIHLTKSDYEANDILDQLYESNTYE